MRRTWYLRWAVGVMAVWAAGLAIGMAAVNARAAHTGGPPARRVRAVRLTTRPPQHVTFVTGAPSQRPALPME